MIPKEMSNFFDFSSKFVLTTVTAYPISPGPEQGYGEVCNDLNLITGDYGAISFPITFKQQYGKKFHDILDTGHSALFLISDHMTSILRDNNLTGWKTFPIQLLDKKGNVIKGYQGLSIIGRCGPIDISKSEIIHKRRISEGPICKFYKGLYIGLESWDGSDFFLPKHYYGTIITSKAADVIRANELTNIQLKNLKDVEITEGAAELIKSKA
jgi:hypothetical protein